MKKRFSTGLKTKNEFDFSANLKRILNKFAEANGDKDLITAAKDKLQPLITAANIGKFAFKKKSKLKYFSNDSIHFL